MGYTDSLGYEPEAGAIFVAVKEGESICITRHFDENYENRSDFPKSINGPSRSDTSGKLITTGRYDEYLVQYNGKKWRRI